MKKLSMMSRMMFVTIAAAGLCLGFAVAQAAEEPAKGDASPGATKPKKEPWEKVAGATAEVR